MYLSKKSIQLEGMIKKILLLLLCALPHFMFAQQDFKVIGYLPTYRFSWINDIEFERVTHVNIAFANPDMQGNMSCEGINIAPAVNKAHQSGCKVFISIGGGYLTQAWEDAWDTLTLPANRPGFIQKIVQYVQTQNIDGVDVDLEWQYVKDWYSPFILDLKAALTPLGIPLTAALPGNHRYPKINNQALAAFDWVNMMIYDKTGPWAPNSPGQHSPYAWAVQCVSYWQTQGVSPEKLTLGVPFYGYDFGVTPVASFTFRGIVTQDPFYAQLDNIGQKYWNGIPTIEDKTMLALNEVSGVMIWELGQDAFGSIIEYSLLRAIDKVVDEFSMVSSQAPPTTTVGIYPNPVNDQLRLRLPDQATYEVRIFDVQGRLQLEQTLNTAESITIMVQHLRPGIYALQIKSDQRVLSGKFVKG